MQLKTDSVAKQFTTALVLLLLSSISRVDGVDDNAADPTASALQPVFRDDFSKDTRGDYEIKGDAAWEVGKLTLAEGASITREIDGGPWVKVNLKFAEEGWAGDQENTELRFWFLLNGATNCYIRIRGNDTNKAEKPATVALIDTGTNKQGQSIENLVRELPLQASDDHFILEYRSGMVVVIQSGTPVLKAFIDNREAVVAGCRLEAANRGHTIAEIVIEANRPPPLLTPDQRKAFSDAMTQYRSMFTLYRQGRYSEAAEIGRRVLRLNATAVGYQHPQYASSLSNLAVLYSDMGDFAGAEPLHQEAIQIRRQVFGTQHPAFATSLNNLAELMRNTGQPGAAEGLCRRALEIRRSVLGEQHPDYAVSLNNLAAIYNSLGDTARAEQLYRQAVKVRRSVLGEQHADYAISLNNLAALYVERGDPALAEPLFEQAIEITKVTSGADHPDYATNLNNLARLKHRLGRTTEAKSLYLKCLEIWRAAGGEQHPAFAASLSNVAGLYFDVGDYELAEKLYKQAYEIRKSVLGEQHPKSADNLNNLAAVYRHTGNISQAATLHLQAHNVHTNAAARALPSLSDAQARTFLEAHRPRTDLLLSTLRSTRKWNSSDAYRAVWKTKHMISRLRVGQDPPPNSSPDALEAFARLRDARQRLAKLVSATPSPNQAAAYQQALKAANEKKETLEKQLAILNPASERELLSRDASIDDLLRHLPEGTAVVDFMRLHHWAIAETEINLQKQDGASERRTVKKETNTPVYDAFVTRSDRPPTEPPTRWISLGPAAPIESAIRRWREQLSNHVSLQPTGAVTEQTESRPSTVSTDKIAPDEALRTLIWDKLEPELRGCQSIVLLPDGALHRLPWAALPDQKAGRNLVHKYALTTAASGQQLFSLLSAPPIDTQFGLLTAGGIQYDQRPVPNSAEPEQPLLTAGHRALDISNEARNWTYLQGTAAETTNVAHLWKDRGPARQLTGRAADEFTLARFLPKSRYAHLATHGFFDTRGEIYRVNLRDQSLFSSTMAGSRSGSSLAARNPLLMTGIVLAGANIPPDRNEIGLPAGDDGILTAEEILGLDLTNTELVTLSACETGLGDVVAGEGVMGLTRVLHEAGVRTVLASLWKVDDAATTELMRLFYSNLWEKKLSKLEALREAQLTMLNHYDAASGRLRGLGGNKVKVDQDKPAPKPDRIKRLDPRYWAAFQLSGDWR